MRPVAIRKGEATQTDAERMTYDDKNCSYAAADPGTLKIERAQSCPHDDFRLLFSELQENRFLLCEAPPYVVLCYGSHNNLIRRASLNFSGQEAKPEDFSYLFDSSD